MTTKTTYSVKFYCKESKASKDGQSPLQIAINCNGERFFINLPTKFNPKEFNKKKQPQYITDIVESYRIKVYNVINDLLKYNIPITSYQLKEYFKCGGVKSRTIKYMWEEYYQILKNRKLNDLSKYNRCKLICYEYFGENRELSTITNKDIVMLVDKLKLNYKQSTLAGILTKIKSAFVFAKDNDYIKVNLFNGIKIEKGKEEITYLSNNEINTLIDNEIKDNESLENIRKIAIVLLATGLSYADLKLLKKEDIQENNGTYYIIKNRQKTNHQYTSVILPFAYDIINEFNFKVLSNQKINTYLKVLGDILNINQKLHCHLFRHTYATILLNQGVDMSIVAKTLGHQSEKTTAQYYAKLKNETIINVVTEKLNL